jgi:predicted CopG family antitoxin
MLPYLRRTDKWFFTKLKLVRHYLKVATSRSTHLTKFMFLYARLRCLCTYSPYRTYMAEVADKRIPVTRAVWESLFDLNRPGETFSQLLEEMIENEKKARLFRDLDKIEEEDEFVEMQF